MRDLQRTRSGSERENDENQNQHTTQPLLEQTPFLCSLVFVRFLSKQLVRFLKDFHNDRAEDEQFSDEKEFVIKQINELK